MNEFELLSNWGVQKTSQNYMRLLEAIDIEHEFKGQFGHPSSYARVAFRVKPAEELSLEFEANWPAAFDSIYTLRIQHSIAEAVLDGLFIDLHFPHRGCALTLTTLGWDEIGGSEVAVRKATSKAMEKLKAQGKWAQVTGRSREYHAPPNNG